MTTLRLLVLLVCLPCIWGKAEGPPERACYDLQPGTEVGAVGLEGHVTMAQNKLPVTHRINPFYLHIKLDRDHYIPGESIEVHIGANQTLGLNRFKGVLMQARQLQCRSNQTIPVYTEVDEEPLGTFTLPTGNRETLLKTMDCQGIERSAVSHGSPQFKTDELVTWNVPSDQRGFVVFRATFVDEVTLYWTEVHSRVLSESEDSTAPICGGSWLRASWMFVAAILFFVLEFTS